jgi:hypothetical protein
MEGRHRYRSGSGGGARRDGSRWDGRRRLGRPREGDEGGAGRVGCEGRVDRMPLGPAQRENKKKEREMGRKDDWAKMILGCAEKKEKVFRF